MSRSRWNRYNLILTCRIVPRPTSNNSKSVRFRLDDISIRISCCPPLFCYSSFATWDRSFNGTVDPPIRNLKIRHFSLRAISNRRIHGYQGKNRNARNIGEIFPLSGCTDVSRYFRTFQNHISQPRSFQTRAFSISRVTCIIECVSSLNGSCCRSPSKSFVHGAAALMVKSITGRFSVQTPMNNINWSIFYMTRFPENKKHSKEYLLNACRRTRPPAARRFYLARWRSWSRASDENIFSANATTTRKHALFSSDLYSPKIQLPRELIEFTCSLINRRSSFSIMPY